MPKGKLNLAELANESFFNDLATALSVDPEVLSRLAQKVNTSAGFGIDDADQVEVARIWAESGMPADKVRDALGVLRYLFKSGIENEVSADALLEEIRLACAARNVAGFEPRVDALRQFLTPNEAYLEKQRYLPYAQGMERNLEGISGVVGLRAVFKGKKSTDLMGYVPVVSVRVTCGFDDDDKEHRVRVVFQLTKGGLNKLIRSLEAYRDQLAKALQSLPGTIVCFGREDVEDDDKAED